MCDVPNLEGHFCTFFLKIVSMNNVREQCPCAVTQTVRNTVHCCRSIACTVRTRYTLSRAHCTLLRAVATHLVAPTSSLVATRNFCRDRGGLVPCHDTISISRHKASLPCPNPVTTLPRVATQCPEDSVATENPLSRPCLPSPSPNPVATQRSCCDTGPRISVARVIALRARLSRPCRPVMRSQARSCACPTHPVLTRNSLL